MASSDVMPELKQILGALVFGAARPLSLSEMRGCVLEVAAEVGGDTAVFAEVKPRDIREALEALAADLERARCGFHLAELAGGFRLQSDAACGVWLKQLLNMGKPNRLSQPALETLAIIAYRQPVSRVDIEGVRGVNVDHMVKQLMELQLVKIVGRSELPGRPFLYGTTQLFLEHFGLKSLKDLDDLEPMLRARREIRGATQPAAELAGEPPASEDAAAAAAAVSPPAADDPAQTPAAAAAGLDAEAAAEIEADADVDDAGGAEADLETEADGAEADAPEDAGPGDDELPAP